MSEETRTPSSASKEAGQSSGAPDKTKREAALVELEKSEERLRFALEVANEGFYDWDLQTGEVYFSPRYYTLLGYEPNEMPASYDTWETLLHPDDRDNAIKVIGEYNDKDRKRHQIEFRMRAKSGRWLWILGRGEVVERNAAGKAVRVIGTHADITERKQAEEDRSRFSQLVDVSPASITIHDAKGNFLYANQKTFDLHGYTRAEFMALNLHDIDVSASEGLIEENMREIRDRGEASFDVCHFRKDGSILPLHINVRQSSWKDEPVFESVAVDITERKRMEEHIHQVEKMDSIGQLAGGVANDFNNQLGGIMNYADLLLANTKDEKLNQYIGAIIRSCTRCKDLTGQLLAFSRKGKYQIIPVNIHQTIAEVVSMLEHSIDKRIAIRQLLEANPATAAGDPTQLQNALLNIALNARDAMPKGGELVFTTVTVTLDEEHCNKSRFDIAPDDYLKVTVADCGTGMDEATRAKVFEPFFTTKEQGKGTGMGLASVYGTIINHHGAIEVDSEVGRGTTMTVYLPLSKKEAQKTHATVQAVAAKSGEARILLVDDEKGVRESTALLLRLKGYKVVTSEDGAEAVEYYQKSWQHIDLVILDMNMPVMNGRDAFVAMREMNPEVKAILATGYSLTANTQEILDEGALSYIQKPYRNDDLVQKMKLALGV